MHTLARVPIQLEDRSSTGRYAKVSTILPLILATTTLLEYNIIIIILHAYFTTLVEYIIIILLYIIYSLVEYPY